MTSPHAKPAFGAWRYEDGRLTITEEGQDYPTDILALSDSAFRIRMQSPGEPVEMLLKSAEQPPMSAIAEAKPAAVATQAEIEPAAVSLWGTAWRLESLAGADVLDSARATLEFPSEGRASGNGSCNRFNGVVTVEGNTIQFGGLAATRMACAEAAMRQEDAYFAALRDAERFEVDGEALRIYSAGRPGAAALHRGAGTGGTSRADDRTRGRDRKRRPWPASGPWSRITSRAPAP